MDLPCSLRLAILDYLFPSKVAQPWPLNGSYDVFCLFRYTRVLGERVVPLGHGLESYEPLFAVLARLVPLGPSWRPAALLNIVPRVMAFSVYNFREWMQFYLEQVAILYPRRVHKPGVPAKSPLDFT